MARPRSISLEYLPELVRRHRAGETLRALAGWLASTGCKVSPETVRAELAKAGQTAQARAEIVLPEAEPLSIEDELRLLRYEIGLERREARKGRRTNWKRYHGALRLTVALSKIKTRPAPRERFTAS